MKILKIINNNVVSSLDKKGKEVVIMGKGIGFGKKPEDVIDEASIEKIFSMPKEHTSEFEQLIEDIPYEQMQAAESVIQYAIHALGRKLNKNIYITLTDHLNFAIERQAQGVAVENALLWEIQKFYNAEYQIGCKALEIVKEQLGVELSEDEAGFIALHIVNAEMDESNMRQVSVIPGMMKDILEIVRNMSDITIQEKGIAYERFVTHLKFFIPRAVAGDAYDEVDEEVFELLKKKYPKAYEGAVQIKEYVVQRIGYVVPEEELMYLMIHIARIAK